VRRHFAAGDSSENGLGGEGVLERLEDLVGFVEAIGTTQRSRARRGVEIRRVELEGSAKRRLVTGVHELVDLRRSGRASPRTLAPRLWKGPDEGIDDLALVNREDRGID